MRSCITVAMAAALEAACFGASEGSKRDRTLSCDRAGIGLCETLMGKMTDEDVGHLQSSCTALGGTNIDGVCPTDNTVPGHCRWTTPSGSTEDAYYDSRMWTLQAAQADCASPPTGTWVLPTAGGSFSATGSMTTARTWHTSTLLVSGKVLVAGGIDASAELYDPASGTFSATGSMTEARGGLTATLLPQGKVLMVGGDASAELYDPASGTFSATGGMATARHGHTATLLPDGKVLVAGGGWPPAASAELYDPVTGAFSAAGDMAVARYGHTATLLPSGKVLVAGGGSAELYDPATGDFTSTGSMIASRSDHTATLLSSGKVLMAGGSSDSSAELYDPATGAFSGTGGMAERRIAPRATLLPDGRVLVTGGWYGTPMLPAPGPAELYDPAAGTFAATGTMATERYGHAATLLPGGMVLVVGGNDGVSTLRSAELFTP